MFSRDGHKKVKCLQYGSYYCLEVMTMSCQREVFSETEKRQRLVTQQEHKDDSYITLLSRNKKLFFYFCWEVPLKSVSVLDRDDRWDTHSKYYCILVKCKKYTFFYIFCHYHFLCLNRKMLVLQTTNIISSLFLYYLAMYE